MEEYERQEEIRKQREAAQLARRNREVAELSRLFECALCSAPTLFVRTLNPSGRCCGATPGA